MITPIRQLHYCCGKCADQQCIILVDCQYTFKGKHPEADHPHIICVKCRNRMGCWRDVIYGAD